MSDVARKACIQLKTRQVAAIFQGNARKITDHLGSLNYVLELPGATKGYVVLDTIE